MRPQHVSAQRQASAALRSPPKPPPAASEGHPAQIPFSTPAVSPKIPPVSTSRTNRQEKAAAAPSVTSAVPQIPFMAPLSATAAARRQDIADDELLLASRKQAPSQLLSSEQPTSTAESTDGNDDTQQSQADSITASITEADSSANNGRSPPRASDQAVMTVIESPQPPSEETGTDEIEATGESLPQAGKMTAENASFDRTSPEVSDTPAIDTAVTHNGDSDDVVDQPLILPQSESSVKQREASMQAASSPAKVASTTPSSVNDLDAAVTATDDSIEAQTQGLTDQPTPQSSSVLPAMEAAVAALPSTSDPDPEQAPASLLALPSTLDAEQMNSQASLPGGTSTSERGQIQSQASLPAVSNARAAAVAEAIKRAAQASGQGQPQPHGMSDLISNVLHASANCTCFARPGCRCMCRLHDSSHGSAAEVCHTNQL